jgi:hypothetical protein
MVAGCEGTEEGGEMPVLAGSWVMEAIEILMGTGVGLRGLGGTTDFIFLLPLLSRAPDSSSTIIGSRSAQMQSAPSVLQCLSFVGPLLTDLEPAAELKAAELKQRGSDADG